MAAAEVGIGKRRVDAVGRGQQPRAAPGPAGLRGRHAREEPAADAAELRRVAAADQRREVPAGQLLPQVAVGGDREEVGGGLELLVEVGAHAHVRDAGPVGRVVLERGAGIADQDRDLTDARDVGQLRERNRQPGAAGLHGRHRRGGHGRQPGRERLHRGHDALAAVGGLLATSLARGCVVAQDRGGPGEAVGIVDRPGERRGDDVHEVVDHEVAKGDRQEIVAEDRLGDQGDLRTMALAGEVARDDRDGNPHQVERVAGRIGRVVALVDLPQLVQVIEVAGELVEMERGLEAERLGAEARALGAGGQGEGGRAGDHDRLGPAHGLVGRGDKALDRVDHAGGARRLRHGHLIASPAVARRGLQGERHAQKGLVAAAEGGARATLEPAQLRPHLGLVFGTVSGEPVLAPDVGSLGDDRAVVVEVVLEPEDLAGELVEAGIGGNGRRVAVDGAEGARQAAEEPRKLGGCRRCGQAGGNREHDRERSGPRPAAAQDGGGRHRESG